MGRLSDFFKIGSTPEAIQTASVIYPTNVHTAVWSLGKYVAQSYGCTPTGVGILEQLRSAQGQGELYMSALRAAAEATQDTPENELWALAICHAENSQGRTDLTQRSLDEQIDQVSSMWPQVQQRYRTALSDFESTDGTITGGSVAKCAGELCQAARALIHFSYHAGDIDTSSTERGTFLRTQTFGEIKAAIAGFFTKTSPSSHTVEVDRLNALVEPLDPSSDTELKRVQGRLGVALSSYQLMRRSPLYALRIAV